MRYIHPDPLETKAELIGEQILVLDTLDESCCPQVAKITWYWRNVIDNWSFKKYIMCMAMFLTEISSELVTADISSKGRAPTKDINIMVTQDWEYSVYTQVDSWPLVQWDNSSSCKSCLLDIWTIRKVQTVAALKCAIPLRSVTTSKCTQVATWVTLVLGTLLKFWSSQPPLQTPKTQYMCQIG